jgi:hypothetical protein
MAASSRSSEMPVKVRMPIQPQDMVGLSEDSAVGRAAQAGRPLVRGLSLVQAAVPAASWYSIAWRGVSQSRSGPFQLSCGLHGSRARTAR